MGDVLMSPGEGTLAGLGAQDAEGTGEGGAEEHYRCPVRGEKSQDTVGSSAEQALKGGLGVLQRAD